MKNTLLLAAGLFMASLIHSQNCNIGNEDTLNFNMKSGFFTQNFLLGVKFTLNTQGVLNSINLIGKNTGSQVQMAVYNDNNGSPNRLVVASGTTTVGRGVITLPVNPTNLSPGDYWVMAVYDSTAFHTYEDSTATNNVVYYDFLSFGSPIPNNASNFQFYTGDDYTYFLNISCGTVGVDERPLNHALSIYPNPASDFIRISNVKEENSILEIMDFAGNRILRVEIKSGDSDIPIGHLSKGNYLVIVNNRLLQKIVIE